MKKLFSLFSFLVFVFMLTGETAQQTNAQFSVVKPKFQFKISVSGAPEHPDSAFEALVRTYVKRELNLLPDVEVVPKDATGGFYYTVQIIGWESRNVAGVRLGNIVLSSVTITGIFDMLVYHSLHTAKRDDLSEVCTTLVGMIDTALDEYRK